MDHSMLEAMHEGRTYQRVELITGGRRRRSWTAEEKARIVAESAEPNANISDVARRNGVNRGLLTVWRRQAWEARSTSEHEALFVSAVSVPLPLEWKNSLQFVATRHCTPLAQSFASD